MEVHHHSHTARKKWTHYFWEFFMLFLAVFCGFLAEYQLEHKIEKDREKQYVQSLVRDLENDTLQFGKTMARVMNKLPYYDSVLQFLKDPARAGQPLPFRFYIRTNLEVFYRPVNATLEQLKNSGNLRLIGKQYRLDSIIQYDGILNGNYKNQVDYVVEANKNLIRNAELYFDFEGLNHFLNDQIRETDPDPGKSYDTAPLVNAGAGMSRIYNIYVSCKATDFFYINILEFVKARAIRLLAFLKKEYHLK